MILTLSEAQFINDMFHFELPDGDMLTMNIIDESIATRNSLIELNNVNIEIEHIDVETGEVSYYSCPTIIGFEGERTKIDTLFTEHYGEVLNKDNISLCTLEYYE